MADKEPPWLTALYTVAGTIIIALGVVAAALIAAYWPFFLALGTCGALFWWFTKSPWALERQAKNRTAALLYQLAAVDTDRFPSEENFAAEIIAALGDTDDHSLTLPRELFAAITDMAQTLYAAEQFTLAAVREPPALLGGIEGARYQEHLERQYRKLSDPLVFDAFRSAVLKSLHDFMQAIPAAAFASRADQDGQATAALHIPLVDVLPNIIGNVEDLILPFYSEQARSVGVFVELRDQFDRNLHEASGVPFTSAHKNSPKLVMPTEYKGSDPVRAYLHHTPFEPLFAVQIPFEIPESLRFEHTHILAGSGHGKTQTLQHLLVSDLTQENHPSLIIIDSQGDMLRKISRLALFDPNGGKLASKLIIIDPSDVEYPPALNMFDVNFERLGQYNTAAREQILNGVIELYDYIFGSLLGAELTQKQSVIFRYLARLMLTIPGATIHTLIELMNDAAPFMQHIEQLPPGARMFFETEFPHKSFAETKRQIQRRLWGILENPTFERMLTAPQNRIDMFDALNTGKIVLVNTAKDFLKAERSSFLGRFFIAMTLQAALERAALPEGKRRPAFLVIDEAADYFDRNIDDLLTQARKYQLGILLSHQHLDQLAPGLRSSIASNTSIKLAGGISDRDARSMAPDMRTTPTFLLEQRKAARSTQFACYLRNVTPHALSLSVPFGTLERQPTMSAEAYQRLQDDNRARVSASVPPFGPTSTASSPPTAPSAPRAPLLLPAPTKTSDATSGDDWSG